MVGPTSFQFGGKAGIPTWLFLALTSASPLGWPNATYDAISKRMVTTDWDPIHVPLHLRDQVYRVRTLFGRSQDEYEMSLDTGSWESWVRVGPDKGYDKTGQNLQGITKDIDLTYISGPHIQGTYFSDRVQFDGINLHGQTSWIFTDFPFGVLNLQEDEVFTNKKALLGWGYFPVSAFPNAPESILQRIMKSLPLEQRETAIYLPPLAEGVDATGQLTIGGRDTSRIRGPIATMPVTETRGWRFNIDGIQLGGTFLEIPDTLCTAIADSGQNGFSAMTIPAILWHQLIPNARLDRINNRQIPEPQALDALRNYYAGGAIAGTPHDQIGSVQFSIPCNITQQDIPSLVMNGQPLAIDAAELPIPGDKVLLPGYCRSWLLGTGSMPGNRTEWGIGAPFLRNKVMILRWGADQEGHDVGQGASVSFAMAAPYTPFGVLGEGTAGSAKRTVSQI